MAAALTAADVAATLDDPRHGGWGYATSRQHLEDQQVAELDAAVARVATKLGLDTEQLFRWSDSKHGRWLMDDVYGCDAPITEATVLRHMDHAKVAEVQALAAPQTGGGG